MADKKTLVLSRLELQAEDLEQRVEEAVHYHETIEAHKELIKREEIDRDLLRQHKADLEAAPEIDPFMVLIDRIAKELERRQEELKEIYREWPKELQARDSARYAMEGLQSRFQVMSVRLREAKLRLAQESLKRAKKKEGTWQEAQRRWNEKVIASEVAKVEREQQSSQKVARLNELKADQARNQDTSQPPPTITPNTNV